MNENELHIIENTKVVLFGEEMSLSEKITNAIEYGIEVLEDIDFLETLYEYERRDCE